MPQRSQTDQPLVEVETSKSTFEIQSPASGVIQRVVAEKIEVPVGDVLCYIGESLAEIEAFRTSRTARPGLSPAAAAPASGRAESRGPAADYGRSPFPRIRRRWAAVASAALPWN